MTYEEFKKLARMGGLVRWTTSGIVERIESGPGGFLATNPINGRSHHVFNRGIGGKIRQVWYCEEVTDLKSLIVEAGVLFDAINLGKNLVAKYKDDR